MEFFGLKTIAWFDVWSFEHFVSGIVLGALLHKIWPRFKQGDINDNPLPFFITILLISYMWEGVEFYLEAGYTGIDAVTYWFQGVEFWGNRLITDPMMMVLGTWAYKESKCRILIPRIFSIIWLVTHIFIFPHSMWLHEIFA